MVERDLAKVDVARSNRVARLLLSFNLMIKILPPSSRGLGQLPFTEQTGIRIPLGVIFDIYNIRKESRINRKIKLGLGNFLLAFWQIILT